MNNRYKDLSRLSKACALTKEQVLWARAIYRTKCYPVKNIATALHVEPKTLYNALHNGYEDCKREPLVPLRTVAPEWIPCSKGLPATREYVLVTYRNGTIDKDFYDGERWQYEDGMGDVIAWMRLPEPYEST